MRSNIFGFFLDKKNLVSRSPKLGRFVIKKLLPQLAENRL